MKVAIVEQENSSKWMIISKLAKSAGVQLV